jgi:DeoR family ulaG and ulaABCDEF operon transcriptional repressor
MILTMLQERGFIAFQELDRRVDASPATLRRDLDRLETSGRIVRVRGGARLADSARGPGAAAGHLSGVPFHENIALNRAAKEAIGRSAAALCTPGESIIIDGGSTTLQMCPHLEPLGLQVLTNSLHIVSALLPQPNTRISMPGGALFREQNILLSPFDEDGMVRYRASKIFLGAAAIGRHGLMQTDVLLVQAERHFLERAEQIIVLVDSSKFEAPAGHVVCGLDVVDIVVSDAGVDDSMRRELDRNGVHLIIAEP